jgi:hypothetical protein
MFVHIVLVYISREKLSKALSEIDLKALPEIDLKNSNSHQSLALFLKPYGNPKRNDHKQARNVIF